MTDSPTPAAPEAATITTDVLLIGGGVAAAAAAAELRTRGFDGSVLLVTRELDPPYERPPVTKELLTGRCTREQLLWGDDAWWAERDVEVRTRCAVTALDTEARRATLSTKETVAFGAALVATGAMVRRLAVDGAGLEGVHYLRAPGNAEALRRELEVAERVVVVGGSFIACEVAASVTELGKPCVLVMQEDRPLERQFGAVMGDFIASLLTSKGIELVCGDDVVAFEGAGGGEAEGDGGAAERVAHVVTAGGRRFAADVVVAGVGALPDAMLARRAGLAIGESGGIRCDARLRTSAAGIWAAGDACEYDSVLHGGPVRIEHHEHAIAQGRTVARNIAGEAVEHDVVPYFWSDLSDWARVEYVGLGGARDEERLSGDPASGAFTLWHVRDERVVGAVAVGRPQDVELARELIARGAPAAELPRAEAVAR